MTLSADQIRQYQDRGYVFPHRVLDDAEVADYRARLEATERSETSAGHLKFKPHLVFTFLDDLIRHPKILNAVEGVIGPISLSS